MKLADMESGAVLLAGGVALLAVFYVWRTGAGQVAQNVAEGVVNGVGGVVSGVTTGTVNGVSTAVGIPTTQQTITDPAQARWVIDRYGYWEASFWTSAGALVQGGWMDPGTGTEPPASSAFMLAHQQGLDLGGTWEGGW